METHSGQMTQASLLQCHHCREETVSASQPKKARQSNTVKGASSNSQFMTLKQIETLTRATKDLQALNKEIHFMLAKLLRKKYNMWIQEYM